VPDGKRSVEQIIIAMTDERVREAVYVWYSLFNLPHRESVAAVHDRVVTANYQSLTGDGPGECWGKGHVDRGDQRLRDVHSRHAIRDQGAVRHR
jgi:hypothetical protein